MLPQERYVLSEIFVIARRFSQKLQSHKLNMIKREKLARHPRTIWRIWAWDVRPTSRIENNTGYSGWTRVSVAHALIGPQSLKLAHFWSDIIWFPPLLFLFIPLHDLKRAGENATVPASPPGDHSQVESPARGYCAKNSACVNKAG